MRRLIALLVLLLGATAVIGEEWQVRKKVDTNFDDTRDAIVSAIENRGLVINNISHLGDMLKRTGADLGATRQIFRQAEIIQFCSAVLSRRMMEADPHDIVLCPFSIAVYTLPGEQGGTWVAYRRPPGAAAAIIDPLLSEIAAEADR